MTKVLRAGCNLLLTFLMVTASCVSGLTLRYEPPDTSMLTTEATLVQNDTHLRREKLSIGRILNDGSTMKFIRQVFCIALVCAVVMLIIIYRCFSGSHASAKAWEAPLTV